MVGDDPRRQRSGKARQNPALEAGEEKRGRPLVLSLMEPLLTRHRQPRASPFPAGV